MKLKKQHKHKLPIRWMNWGVSWETSVFWRKISLFDRAILWQHMHGGKFIPQCRKSWNSIPF